MMQKNQTFSFICLNNIVSRSTYVEPLDSAKDTN